MSTQTDAMGTAGESQDAADAVLPQGLAEQLVAQAKASGVALTGPGGLLTGLTKQVLETALNTEMTEHLGHEHGGTPVAKGNVRNGYSAKTVRTEIGDVRIQVPRDRAGSFEPVMVPKHARHLSGFDEAVISLYAKGMTTGDIVNHLADVYEKTGHLKQAVDQWERSMTEYAHSLPADADPQDIAKVKHKLDDARIKLAKLGPTPSKKS